MKYQGKYRAYIGLIIRNNIHRAEVIQLGTMTPKEAKERRKTWKIQGFDWILWRKPTKEELKLAKSYYEKIYDPVYNPLTSEE